MVISRVHGRFGKWTGTLLDAGDLAIGDKVEIAIEVEALKPALVAAN